MDPAQPPPDLPSEAAVRVGIDRAVRRGFAAHAESSERFLDSALAELQLAREGGHADLTQLRKLAALPPTPPRESRQVAASCELGRAAPHPPPPLAPHRV